MKKGYVLCANVLGCLLVLWYYGFQRGWLSYFHLSVMGILEELCAQMLNSNLFRYVWAFFFFWLKLGFQLWLINAWNICASTQVPGIQCFRRVVEPSKAVCLLTWSLSDSCSSMLLDNYIASDIAMTSVCAEVLVATTSGSQVLANDPILGTYHKVFKLLIMSTFFFCK